MKTWVKRIAFSIGAVLLMFIISFIIWAYFTSPSEDTLHGALKDTTSVRVRSGGLCHRIQSTEKVLFQINDKVEIEKLIGRIQIDEFGGIIGAHCMCCGNPTFEFYKNAALIHSIGFHHGRSLRWSGWKWDGLLTIESANYLVSLLKNKGVNDGDYK